MAEFLCLYQVYVECVLCSYQVERKLREAHLKTQINQKLEESGERERQETLFSEWLMAILSDIIGLCN